MDKFGWVDERRGWTSLTAAFVCRYSHFQAINIYKLTIKKSTLKN